jgi:hypothetical protein
LKEFSQFHRLPLYRSNTTLYEVSTYDREGKNDDGLSSREKKILRHIKQHISIPGQQQQFLNNYRVGG